MLFSTQNVVKRCSFGVKNERIGEKVIYACLEKNVEKVACKKESNLENRFPIIEKRT